MRIVSWNIENLAPHVEEIGALLARLSYTWFNPRARGGRLDAARVDFILVSRDLLPFVHSAFILDDPELRRGTDRAPVVVELRGGPKLRPSDRSSTPT